VAGLARLEHGFALRACRRRYRHMTKQDYANV
jgi:hypothetical protein